MARRFDTNEKSKVYFPEYSRGYYYYFPPWRCLSRKNIFFAVYDPKTTLIGWQCVFEYDLNYNFTESIYTQRGGAPVVAITIMAGGIENPMCFPFADYVFNLLSLLKGGDRRGSIGGTSSSRRDVPKTQTSRATAVTAVCYRYYTATAVPAETITLLSAFRDQSSSKNDSL